MTIQLTEEEKIRLLNSEDVYFIMQKILLREDKIDQNREHFWVLGLEQNNRILFVELISLGSTRKTVVEPMEVFSLALQKRAVKLILCHNHPSGELKPSAEDQDITDRLIQIGIIIDLPVLDHLIITDRSFLSFLDIGLFAQLSLSLKYVPNYELMNRVRQQARDAITKAKTKAEERIRLAEQKAQKQIKSIVRALQKQGMDTATIATTVGLSVEEIEQL